MRNDRRPRRATEPGEAKVGRRGGPVAGRLRDEGGYVLLWAIFGFLLVAGLLAASLTSSSSQRRAVNSNARWKASFYAAEAGLREVLASTTDSVVDGMDPGDSITVPWTPVGTSTSYRAVIHRIDDDSGQQLYLLNAVGRAQGAYAGRSAQNLMFTFAIASTKAIAFGGSLEISGNPTISGSCPDVAANSLLIVGGTMTTDGGVSSADTVEVGGAIVDSLGNPVTPQSNGDPVNIPAMDPADYCGSPDYWLRDGWVVDVAASDSTLADGSGIWDWNSGDDVYTLSGDSATPGTVCSEGSISVSGNPGTSASPLSLSLIADGFIEISGNPFLVADHPENILLLATGDLKLNGNAEVGADNLSGTIYGGAQCELSGTPVLFGQLLCMDNPDPPGSKNMVDDNKINGDITLVSDCVGSAAGAAVAISGRAWSQVY